MDIETRKDIETLINSFYDKVKKDATIGFIFTDIVAVNWEQHLPLMYDFWETILLDAGTYQNNAMAVHYAINRKQPLSSVHFDQWLYLFNQSVDALFSGEKAELAKKRALSIAQVMQFKMQQENTL
ncbi:MAG: sec-independent protein translocase TatC [Terrimonas sp.]|nr:sec-independent protein translocase TatC [Terrimonas sp.]